MRTVLPLALSVCACSEPTAELPRGVDNVSIAGVTHVPARDDGKISPIVRTAIELSAPIADARVFVIGGGADDADVLALAKNRATSALRAREIPAAAWLRGSRVFVQPSRALPAGRSTIVVIPEKLAALAVQLEVADDAPSMARRMWTDGKSVTLCAERLGATLEEAIELAPSGAAARIVRHRDLPCFDVVGPVTNAVLPPAIGAVFVDPSTVPPPESSPPRAEPPCPEDAYPLPPLCVRVDDDRIVIVGGAETKRFALGRFGELAVLATITPGARHVVRGFPPLTKIPIELLVRDALGDHRIAQTITTRRARRHVVLNEVLARPASGAATQRFVELVNDGDAPVELQGLVFRDGADEWELPEGVLAPRAFALITSADYVDGLAGDPAPPSGVLRIHVDALRVTGTLSIAEPTGVVLSQFPPTTSTRTVARGRRTPETPDDAPGAFGWDLRNSSTPGRENALAQP